jgi:hypothetical protein
MFSNPAELAQKKSPVNVTAARIVTPATDKGRWRSRNRRSRLGLAGGAISGRIAPGSSG